MIQVNDIFLGNTQLPDVFGELMDSAVLKRLGRVHQSGGVFLVNPVLSHTRLEHSIGVMLLIRQLGGSELEQIAGLLHDASHTAFSHVGDYVFENDSEDYHEKIFEEFIKASEVPSILNKYGYNIEDIIHGVFPILEQPLPRLCADRLDYTLRDSMYGGLITRNEVLNFLRHLEIRDGIIIVDNEEHAVWINTIYERLNNEVFNRPLHQYANLELTRLIKDGLKTGFLTKDDLFKDDTFLLNKIRSVWKGYEGVKSIKQRTGYAAFLKSGITLKVKKRRMDALKADF